MRAPRRRISPALLLTLLSVTWGHAGPSSPTFLPESGFFGLGRFDAQESSWAREIGWNLARIPLRWHEVATDGGGLNWGAADARIEAAADSGMRLHLVLCFTWPKGKPSPFPVSETNRLPSTIEGQRALRSFLDGALLRYRALTDAWGVEDDLSATGFPGASETYAELLRDVAQTVRSAAPGARVVFAPILFDGLEQDQRMFFVSDAVQRLGGGTRRFDAIELRVIGRNPNDDFRRLPAAMNFLRGQLDGTPYDGTDIVLLTSSPAPAASGTAANEQAADLARRVLIAGHEGAAKVYWDPGLAPHAHPNPAWGPFTSLLTRSGLLSDAGAGGLRPTKAAYTAQMLRRIERRGRLDSTRIEERAPGLFRAEIRAREGRAIVIVWRDYAALGTSFASTASIALKSLDFEGPSRQGLHGLDLIPDASGTPPIRALPDTYFSLGGSPVVLSQDVDWLREVAFGASARPYSPTPSYTPAPEPDWPYP